MPEKPIPFIPSRESDRFIPLFYLFCRILVRWRFRRTWIEQHYWPEPDSRTVYYLNHSCWWDGLIPLLLNRSRFRQNGRAMMEDRQMVRYPFFRWLGAFSVDTKNPRRNIPALRYAIQSMKRESSSLYIFPEGGLVPFSTELPIFKPGIYWLSRQLNGVDFVPVGIYVHMLRGDRPELHVRVGEKVPGPFDSQSRPMEGALQMQLLALRESAGFSNGPYERWL